VGKAVKAKLVLPATNFRLTGKETLAKLRAKEVDAAGRV
jgi:hypothetical protein